MINAQIMILDFTNDAHFPMFLRQILAHWIEHNRSGELSVVVSQRFTAENPDLVALSELAPSGNIHFITTTDKESAQLEKLYLVRERNGIVFSQLLREKEQANYWGTTFWNLFCEYAQQIGANVNVLCHIDYDLPVLAAGAPVPPNTAGILFAPMFHFGHVASAEQQARALQHRFMLSRALRQPNIKRLMFSDPFATSFMQTLPNADKTVYIPEPADIEKASPAAIAALRAELGVDKGRKVLLVFGELKPRKGIDLLVSALQQAPATTCRRACIVLAGKIPADYQEIIDSRLDTLAQTRGVQIVRRYWRIPDDQIRVFFGLAAIVVALYRNHPGPSNIILLAAVAQRPILSADFGVMGRTVREHQLGRAVDVNNMAAITEALVTLIDSPESVSIDPLQQEQFARSHDPRLFAQAFFDALDSMA